LSLSEARVEQGEPGDGVKRGVISRTGGGAAASRHTGLAITA